MHTTSERTLDAIMRIHRCQRYVDWRLLVNSLSSCMSIGSFLLTRFRRLNQKWRTLMRNSSFLAKKSAIMRQARSFLSPVALKPKNNVICHDTAEKTPTNFIADPKAAHEGPLIPQAMSLGEKTKWGPQKRPQDADAVEPLLVHKAPPVKKTPNSYERRCNRKTHHKQDTAVKDVSLNFETLKTLDKKIAESAEDFLKASHEASKASLKRKAPTSNDSQSGTFPPAKRAAAENTSAPSAKDVGSPELRTPQVEMDYTWRAQNNLSPEHLSILKSSSQKGLLDDDIINKAQDLLQNQFGDFDGLQPTAAILFPGYSVLKKAVQIHCNEDRVHWLTTYFKNGDILVADSIKTSNLSLSVCKQINSIYSVVVHEPLKHLKFLNVDQQRNTYDCGVFNISFAFEFLAEPTANFQHNVMRDHLISCLQNGRITGFPKKVN